MEIQVGDVVYWKSRYEQIEREGGNADQDISSNALIVDSITDRTACCVFYDNLGRLNCSPSHKELLLSVISHWDSDVEILRRDFNRAVNVGDYVMFRNQMNSQGAESSGEMKVCVVADETVTIELGVENLVVPLHHVYSPN